MLKKRIITAAILIPIVIGVILLQKPLWFTLIFALIVIMGAWEWSTICNFKKYYKYAYCLLFLIILNTLYVVNSSSLLYVLNIVGIIFWFFAILIVCFYQKERNYLPKSSLLLSIVGIFLLIPMWSGLVYLKMYVLNGASLLIFLMLLVWSADTGAYFFGKKWGKKKLANRVSPGKTWEGTIAGLICGVLISVSYIYWIEGNSELKNAFVFLCFITVFISVFGDLMESIIKREANIKDSGSILPGHGGVMDRIDSLTAAVPVFVIGVIYLGIAR